ncbi:MAG: PstS family phosphate ABC transporter substrate-binding protein [Planctomycetes bacterium]|nr:PstS family phosphate ABC transporter substrate-binding protein [Planctomycetota bacterium]
MHSTHSLALGALAAIAALPAQVPAPTHPLAVPPPPSPSLPAGIGRAVGEATPEDVRKMPLRSQEDAMREALKGLVESQQAYSKELSALVDSFPVYSPTANKWEGAIKVTGSSTMGPLLTNLAIGFESMHGTLDIVVRQGGTDSGLKALATGGCDIAAVSRALTAEERASIEAASGKRAVEVTIALDGVCVFVNRDNPLPGITREQCNGVFSIEHGMTPAPLYRWNQLDAGSPLGDEFIRLYIPNDQSGTLKLFREWCMHGEEFTTSMRFIEPGPSSVVNACCAYPLAIGIAGFGNSQPRARTLPVAADAAGPFIEPSVQSIRSHAYPLWRPLNVVWLEASGTQANPAIADWMRYILSETGQDVVASVGFVPPHLEQIHAELGTIEGDRWRR